ncbi:hypothetical protein [Pandoraea commovens]|uniref:Uncharacterized protein n=1 Tax=Pandoraea commovens TaxID=2508289 RepID=A0ABY5Q8Q2_9BURK|nr:hypothetical protein [Pandoraea commovens]UVA77132.1 hypothetical protein NTU39_00310 [Pandoraea commovens]
MRKEYDLQTDVLETIIGSTPVSKKHTDLLAVFAARTDYRGIRYVTTRDEFGERPARVIGANGEEIASDYYGWIRAELAAHGGSVSRLWTAFKDSRYCLVEVLPLLHYFVYDRGGEQDNFVQFAVWEEQEIVQSELFPSDEYFLPTAEELSKGWSTMSGNSIERRTLGEPRYLLKSAIDMQRFLAVGESLYEERRRTDGARKVVMTRGSTGESRVVTIRELTDGYDESKWPARRFFDDWTASSAGIAGERACLRWAFRTADHTSENGVRHLDFVPRWAHSRKIAELKSTSKLDIYSLFGKLKQLDERVGMSFAWYFYGIHGNLVKSGQMERVLKAAEEGLIVLPEQDYRVLRQWSDDPYGF